MKPTLERRIEALEATSATVTGGVVVVHLVSPDTVGAPIDRAEGPVDQAGEAGGVHRRADDESEAQFIDRLRRLHPGALFFGFSAA